MSTDLILNGRKLSSIWFLKLYLINEIKLKIKSLGEDKKIDNRSLLEREHKDFPINRKDDQEYSQDNWNRGIKENGPNPNSLLD